MSTGSRITSVSSSHSSWLRRSGLPWRHSQEDVAGKTFYTAANIWYENPKKILSTNYHRGTILPVGTKVTVDQVKGKKIRFTDGSGQQFEIEFVKKHSSDGVDTWAYFQPVLLSRKTPCARAGPTSEILRQGEAKHQGGRDRESA